MIKGSVLEYKTAEWFISNIPKTTPPGVYAIPGDTDPYEKFLNSRGYGYEEYSFDNERWIYYQILNVDEIEILSLKISYPDSIVVVIK